MYVYHILSRNSTCINAIAFYDHTGLYVSSIPIINATLSSPCRCMEAIIFEVLFYSSHLKFHSISSQSHITNLKSILKQSYPKPLPNLKSRYLGEIYEHWKLNSCFIIHRLRIYIYSKTAFPQRLRQISATLKPKIHSGSVAKYSTNVVSEMRGCYIITLTTEEPISWAFGLVSLLFDFIKVRSNAPESQSQMLVRHLTTSWSS